MNACLFFDRKTLRSFLCCFCFLLVHLQTLHGEENLISDPLIQHERLLEDTNPRNRKKAIDYFGVTGLKLIDIVPKISLALKDPDPVVRYSAAYALGNIGPNAHKATLNLIQALKDDVLTGVAIDALGKIGPLAHEAVEPLGDYLKCNDGRIRCATALAIWKITGDGNRVIDVFREALQDTNEVVRGEASLAVMELGESAKPLLPNLIKLVEFDDHLSTRVSIVMLMGDIGADDPVIFQSLVKALSDKEPSIRYRAILAISQRKEALNKVISELNTIAKNDKTFVGRAAKAALESVAAQEPVNADSPVKSAGNKENHEVQERKDGK
jgi:HEAT repeat protein